MTKENVTQRILEIEGLARSLGLDFYPTIYEFVNKDIMLEACSYGLPVRARHWSYGKSYQHSKIYGEMGLSRVYEIVFNNNPAYAFLMDNNTDIVNIMVGAHVMGHVHFFKNNIMFKDTDRSMVHRAAERATRVDSYIEQYGMDKVEHLMDIGMALDRHIDWNKGVYRKKYPARSTIQQRNNVSEFNDLSVNKHARRLKKVVLNDSIPPHPEKDILWFLVNYGNLEDWEIDVLTILREEAFYFYPIVATKILNEGFASFFHAELMYQCKGITEEEYLDFAKCHSGVINPGNMFNINPYYIGFKILTDIREKWDKLHSEGKSEITGIQKVIQVAAEEDDYSFLRNYLTEELAGELGLFNYGYRAHRKPGMKKEDLKKEHGIIELKDRDLQKIIDNMMKHTVNYGAPLISIIEVDGDTLVMKHDDRVGPLDQKYTEKTLGYIYELWGCPVELETYGHEEQKITYYFDESGFGTL